MKKNFQRDDRKLSEFSRQKEHESDTVTVITENNYKTYANTNTESKNEIYLLNYINEK